MTYFAPSKQNDSYSANIRLKIKIMLRLESAQNSLKNKTVLKIFRKFS